MITLAFIGMSLAWSFSWFAMKLQVDSGIPLELSVFYRFVVTSFLMFLLCFITKQRVLITRSEVKFLLLGGLFNFCLNFLLGYFIIRYIPSGVLATIFSLSIITSEIISSIIQKRKIEQKVVISSVIGVIGLAFFILPSITFGENSNFSKVMTGLGLSLVMMIIYSLGNAVIAQNKKVNQTPLYTTIAYASGIGSIFLLLFNLALGNEFVFDTSPKYILSFLYLVIIASVLAFICLFYMIQKIGSTKANYTSLVYPTIALITSSYFEGFSFGFFSFCGFVMIIAALVIEFLPNVRKYRQQ